ncbi:arrestin-C-like [Salvelinus namaycush]|uniref:Arrestin-C n=1 Tax=Salvelinus namaycush TaxID=8040 RepID=A0A8U0P976_SALNM|nr:arrestin-C-like [Salvelinus namaycush]
MSFKPTKSSSMMLKKGKVVERLGFNIAGKPIPTISEKPVKGFGKMFNSSLNNSTSVQKSCQELESWLSAVDRSGLPGRFKSLSSIALYENKNNKTSVRPDITLVSESTKTIIILELTVPWEDRLEEAYKKRRAKYKGLVIDRWKQGWKAHAYQSRLQGFCWAIPSQSLQHTQHHWRAITSTNEAASLESHHQHQRGRITGEPSPAPTRVYKKTSGNGALTLYLGKRDYVDHVQNVDSIEGVVKIDPADLGGKKVFVQLACAFRYGREDLDVIGLSFRKDIWFKHLQLYPAADHKPTLTPMHDCLLKKAGEQGHAFTFDIPINLPCSVTLQPGPDDAGKACGVDFEVKTYISDVADPEEKLDKKDTARLIVRKIQFAPDATGAPGPKADICKSFMMSDKPVHLEASLDKEIYYHGDPINVNVKVKNETTKTVTKIKVTVDQTTDVVLYSADKYTKTVLCQEFGETIDANSTFDKSLTITPLLADNKEKRGLALDGRLKDEDTNLASNTIMRDGMDKEVLGILVSYKIKVNLMVSSGGLLGGLTASDVQVELPLILMNPKPQEVSRWESEGQSMLKDRGDPSPRLKMGRMEGRVEGGVEGRVGGRVEGRVGGRQKIVWRRRERTVRAAVPAAR